MSNWNILVCRGQSNMAVFCLAVLIARRESVVSGQELHLVAKQISGIRGTVTNAVFGRIAAIHTNLDGEFPIVYRNSAEHDRLKDANGRFVIQRIIGVSPGQDTLFTFNCDPMDLAYAENGIFPP